MAITTLRTIVTETIAKLERLPRHLRARLIALRQEHLHTPLDKLPTLVQAEVKRILTSAAMQLQRPSAPPQQALAPQMPTPPVVRHTHAPNGQANGTRPQPLFPAETALTILGTNSKTREAVTISLKERLLGMYVIGSTGTGKTTFDLNMILSDIRQGFGICLIEPHDLTRTVIAAMPEERLKDVLYLDFTDGTSSFGLNFLRVQMERMIAWSPRSQAL